MKQVNRLEAKLDHLKEGKRGALIPYITGGYPDLDFTVELIRRFERVGVSAIEIGFPFSDSIADGPAIQDSFHRVLANGLHMDDLFDSIAKLRDNSEVPLVAMVSYSIIDRIGLDRFVARAVDAGFDGLLAADVPIEEAAVIAESCDKANMKNIMLVATTTPPDRCKPIAAMCSGFIYQVAAKGITGERKQLADDLAANVQRLRQATDLPICVGFGISTPEHVGQVCRLADGAIVGSAIVRRITQAIDSGYDRQESLDSITDFVAELVAATR